MSEFLIKHNISHDVFDNGQTLPASEFQRRITNLTSNLKVLYDDGVIEESFSIKQPELYDSALKLAMRKGMTMDEFFESIGFKRASNTSNPGYLSKIILTERDLYHYGFLSSGTLDELSKFIQQYKVSLAEVENNRFNYQRLVADKNDYLKSYKYQTPQKGE